MFSLASQALKDYTVDLVLHLPLDDSIFFAHLDSADLLPMDSGNKVRAEKTRADRVLCFLDLIRPGADIYLHKLLKVMGDCGATDVMQLADKIVQQQLE